MRGTILKTKWPNEVLTNRHPLGPAKRIRPAQPKAYQRPIAQDVTADRSSAQDFGHGYRYRLRRRVWWRPCSKNILKAEQQIQNRSTYTRCRPRSSGKSER